MARTLMSLAIHFDFVRLHHLLNRRTDVCCSYIDTRCLMRERISRSAMMRIEGITRGAHLHACVRSIFDSGKQVVVCGLPRHGKSGVDDSAVDVHTEIDFEDVLLFKHYSIWSVSNSDQRGLGRRLYRYCHRRSGYSAPHSDSGSNLSESQSHSRTHSPPPARACHPQSSLQSPSLSCPA